MPTLLALFPKPQDLLALEPEELAGVLIEIIPAVSQSAGFTINDLLAQLFSPHGMQGYYPPGIQREVAFTMAESLSWLETQGIIVLNPNQPAAWYSLTRRGRTLKTRTDLEVFKKGRTLPVGLLQESLASKVYHLFLRGDHDTAVFQAFKEVEIAVRKAGRLPDSLTGKKLMDNAFHPEAGALRDRSVDGAERVAEMQLFCGAMGHARNPTGHRDGIFTGPEAARLIVFASHLLDIVEQRALTLGTR